MKKYLVSIVVVLLTLFTGAGAIAHGPAIRLPLYLHCAQTNNMSTAYQVRHLFVFEMEKRSSSGFLLSGKYYRALHSDASPSLGFSEGWFVQNEQAGIV